MKHARIRFALITLMFGIGGPTAYAVTEDDKLTAADAAAADRFGRSVAVSGTTVVVGANFDDDAGSNSGSAYVFDCSSFPCVQASKGTASDAAGGDQLGIPVAVSGTTAVVGSVWCHLRRQTSVIRYIPIRHTNCSVPGCRMGAMVACRIDVSFA